MGGKVIYYLLTVYSKLFRYFILPLISLQYIISIFPPFSLAKLGSHCLKHSDIMLNSQRSSFTPLVA